MVLSGGGGPPRVCFDKKYLYIPHKNKQLALPSGRAFCFLHVHFVTFFSVSSQVFYYHNKKYQFCHLFTLRKGMKLLTLSHLFVFFSINTLCYAQISNQVPLYVEFQPYENAESCEINLLSSLFYFENKETQNSETKFHESNRIYKGLVSPDIYLNTQFKYELSFSYRLPGKIPASRYYVFFESKEGYRYIDLVKSTVTKNPDNTETRTIVFSVDRNDMYRIGICTYSEYGFKNICLYDCLIDWFYADNSHGCSIKNADRP